MITLNIVNKSPFEKRTLEQCTRRIGVGDSVLLIEDAAIAAVAGTSLQEQLEGASKKAKVYVLQPDLQARGFGDADLVEGIVAVDYTKFVDLVVQHQRVHSWL